MGRDKYENEDMLKYGVEADVWFHVDSLSSAHVYLKLQPSWTLDTIPEAVLTDCAQLCKANSIEGCKLNNVKVVYCLWTNLRKLPSHEVGQISFHSNKSLRFFTVEKKVNEIVNRLNKTKEERQVDWQVEKRKFEDAKRKKEREEADRRRKEDVLRLEEERKHKDILHYKGAIDEEQMISNKEASAKDLEDDFFG